MTMQRPNFPAPPTPAPRAKKMTLDAITRGRVEKPMRILLVGTEGIGKSTFAASAPSPIFLGAEDGTAQLDVRRLPQPDDWDDVLDGVRLMLDGQHDYKTFVVDTLDWVEPLCWARVCADAGKRSIEDLGYGKGYVAALDLWRVFLARLDELRDRRGMTIIQLAHSWIKTFKNPEGEDFDRYELKLHAKAAGLVKEWSDAVLFANYETFAVEKKQRVRGVSSGARLLHTTRTAAWDAKNRYGLPETLPFPPERSWDSFAVAVKAASPDALLAQIEALLVGVDEDTAKKAREWLAVPREQAALAVMVTKLRARADQLQLNQSKEETKQ